LNQLLCCERVGNLYIVRAAVHAEPVKKREKKQKNRNMENECDSALKSGEFPVHREA
jgi:hypothetical protein